jgi:hypothetical protein
MTTGTSGPKAPRRSRVEERFPEEQVENAAILAEHRNTEMFREA